MMKRIPIAEITVEMLRERLTYNPNTGLLFWKRRTPDQFCAFLQHSKKWSRIQTPETQTRRWNKMFAAKAAGNPSGPMGYFKLTIFKTTLSSHRVAWAIHYGEWPKEQIDHINGDGGDNRILNLRAVSQLENAKNQKIPSSNKSGVRGISWRKTKGKWVAQIGVNSKTVILGSFSSLSKAIVVRKTAEKKYGYHQNHGRN